MVGTGTSKKHTEANYYIWQKFDSDWTIIDITDATKNILHLIADAHYVTIIVVISHLNLRVYIIQSYVPGHIISNKIARAPSNDSYTVCVEVLWPNQPPGVMSSAVS